MPRVSRGIVAAALALFTTGVAAQETGQQVPTAAQIAEMRANLDLAWANVRAGKLPEDEVQQSMAWGAISMLELMLDRAQAAAAGHPPSDPGAITERVMSEWIALAPESAAPHLVLAQSRHAGDELGRAEAVLAVAERFPDDPFALGMAVQILERRDEAARAVALVERLLARGPRYAKGLRWATNWLRRQRQGDRALELERSWIATHPEDADVLAGHLSEASLPPDERRRLVLAALAADDVRGLQPLCGALQREVELAVSCWQRAGEMAQSDEQRSNAAKALAALTIDPDDPAALEAQLASLSDDEAVRMVAQQVFGLPDRHAQCPRVVELLQRLGQARLESHFATIVSSFRDCLGSESGFALFLGLVERAPPDQVRRAIQPLVIPRHLRRSVPSFPPEAVARVLESRLAREPHPDLNRSMVALWDSFGDEAKVLATYQRWAATGAADLDTRDAQRWASALVDEGQIGAALEVLATTVSRTRSSGNHRDWEDLVEDVAWDGMPGELERLRDILQSVPGNHLSALGRLLTARLALVRERPDEAERTYRELLESEGWLPKAAAIEALEVIGARLSSDESPPSPEDSAALAASAFQACTHDSVLDRRTPSRCAAELLHEAGFSDVALGITRRQLGTNPDPVDLASFAAIARGAGHDQDALWALERLLEISPTDEQAWHSLGELAATGGDAAFLERTWSRARAALGRPHGAITLALARLEIDQGHPRKAIARLEELRAAMPHPGNPAHLELRRAWSALAEPKPSVAELRAQADAGDTAAQRRLGRLLLDEADDAAVAEGRTLVERAASSGDADASWILGWHLLRLGDAAAARPWLERSIEGGRACAGYALAQIELFGLDGEAAPERAVALLAPCAESGDGFSALALGFLAAAGHGQPAGLAGLDRWNETAAAAGTFGWMLVFRLDGIRSDRLRQAREAAIARLVARISERAAGGEPGAQTVLAALHQSGTWVEEDSARAFALGRLAATAGSRSATCLVGQLLRDQPTLAPDQTWQTWYRKAADQGESFCPRWLALWLGENDLSDRGLVIALLERSADLGNYWARLNLAQLWDEGWYGFERNPEHAARWRRHLAPIDPESRGWLLAHGLE